MCIIQALLYVCFLPKPDFCDTEHYTKTYIRTARNRDDHDLQVKLVKLYPHYSQNQLPVQRVDVATLELKEDEDQCDIDHDTLYLHPSHDNDNGYTSE